MLPIHDQKRTVGVLHHRTADRSDEFGHVLTIVRTDDHQTYRPARAGQVFEQADVYRDRFDPQLRVTSLPPGQPAIEVGERPAIGLATPHAVFGRPGSPRDDRLQGGAAQQGLLDGGAQQYWVRGPVYLDDRFFSGLPAVIVAPSDDRHRAARGYGQGRGGGADPARLKVA